jgi:hypothetical protein
LNKKYAAQLGKRPLTAVVIVATRDKMLADLLEGRADVAVGNIKVLPSCRKTSTSWPPMRTLSASRSW